jgi:hypothetical protein
MENSMKVIASFLSILIKIYRQIISPLIGSNCRYQPTCSEYALEALSIHGTLIGCWLSAKRIVKCNPLGGCGYDPVPPKKGKNRKL